MSEIISGISLKESTPFQRWGDGIRNPSLILEAITARCHVGILVVGKPWRSFQITQRDRNCAKDGAQEVTQLSCSENQLHFQIRDAYCSEMWMPTVVISPSDVSCSDIGHAFKKTLMHVLLLIAKWRSEDWKMEQFSYRRTQIEKACSIELNAMGHGLSKTFVSPPPKKSTQRDRFYVSFFFSKLKNTQTTWTT